MATKKRSKKPAPRKKSAPRLKSIRELAQEAKSLLNRTALDRANQLQQKTLDELARWHTLASQYLEPGVDAVTRIASVVPELALRLNLIEKLLWPRALLILRDNRGARCHRVNMPSSGKGLSQAFSFRARHAGRQVVELEQLGAIPLVILTVSVGGELQSEGEQVQAWIRVPHPELEITVVVAVLG